MGWGSLMELLAGFGTLLGKLFSTRLGGWVASALLFFGLSFTTYTFAVTPFRNMIASQLAGAGPLVDWIGAFGIDQAITIVLSAITTKYSIQGARVFLTRRAA